MLYNFWCFLVLSSEKFTTLADFPFHTRDYQTSEHSLLRDTSEIATAKMSISSNFPSARDWHKESMTAKAPCNQNFSLTTQQYSVLLMMWTIRVLSNRKDDTEKCAAVVRMICRGGMLMHTGEKSEKQASVWKSKENGYIIFSVFFFFFREEQSKRMKNISGVKFQIK